MSTRSILTKSQEICYAPLSNRSCDTKEYEESPVKEEEDAEVKSLNGVEVSDKDTVVSSGDSSAAISKEGDEDGLGEEKNPWSRQFVGIPINYFNVGCILGATSILYPILVIQHGVDSSFYSAAASLVTIFWSYKILFGLLSDCFPIRGRKWKPYIVIGWGLCAAMMVVLAFMGEDVLPTSLVGMLWCEIVTDP